MWCGYFFWFVCLTLKPAKPISMKLGGRMEHWPRNYILEQIHAVGRLQDINLFFLTSMVRYGMWAWWRSALSNVIHPKQLEDSSNSDET